MKRDDRIRAMDALKHDPSCEVLLVSLKAGGVGLNLTAAQRVYLMDPYWYVALIRIFHFYAVSYRPFFPSRNPAVENQAVDRIVSVPFCRFDAHLINIPLASSWADPTCDDRKTHHREFHRSTTFGGSEEEDGTCEHDVGSQL